MTTANLFRSASMALALLAGAAMSTQADAREHQSRDKIEKVEKVQKSDTVQASSDKSSAGDKGTEKQTRDKGKQTEKQQPEHQGSQH